MASVTIPISSVGSDSKYRVESSQYPLSNCIGQDSTGTKYAGVNWTSGSNTETILYLDFDTSSIPRNVIIKSVTAKVKIHGSSTGQSRSTTRTIQLYSGDTPKGEASNFTLQSGTVYPINDGGSWTRDELDNTRVKIYILRNSSNSTSSTYIYVMGADVTIEYENAVFYNLTVKSNGYNVTPTSGSIQGGTSVKVTVKEDTLPKVTLDGTDVTNKFSVEEELKYYDAYPSSSSSTGISSNSSSIARAVGQSAENPSTSGSAWYGSNSATVDSQYAQYTFDLSSIPSNATDISITCKVAGSAENSTYTHQSGGRYSVWGLCCNGVAKGEQIHATSTSVRVYTFDNTGSWTREELNNLQLRHYVGYYGGTTNGVTLTIEYSIPSDTPSYIYTFNMGNSDHVLIVGSSESSKLYIKDNDSWKQVNKVYKKINGSWVEQTITSDLFKLSTNGGYLGYKK